MGKKRKICFAGSSGGHFEQLMMLKQLMKKYNSFILAEKTQYTINTDDIPVKYLKQVNRKEKKFIFLMIYNAIVSLWIYLKEKPDIVICTGVLSMIPICLYAKIFKKKLVYIESFAKINSPTLSGKFLYKYADLFLVQWESMLEIYPNAVYKGGIY